MRRDDKSCAQSPSSSSSSSAAVLMVQNVSVAEAYEQYLRLPELLAPWKPGCFPDWVGEGLVNPALQAFEITFRFASLALSDPRGYARRLESLAAREVELVAALCEGDWSAPLAELTASRDVLPRERSGSEVWQLPGSAAAVVCQASERPACSGTSRHGSEELTARIMYAVKGQMQGCAFTLSLSEPNLAGKPVLEYDLHALVTMYQSWLCAVSRLLAHLNEWIEAKD